jgi:hypothetical protein
VLEGSTASGGRRERSKEGCGWKLVVLGMPLKVGAWMRLRCELTVTVVWRVQGTKVSHERRVMRDFPRVGCVVRLWLLGLSLCPVGSKWQRDGEVNEGEEVDKPRDGSSAYDLSTLPMGV